MPFADNGISLPAPGWVPQRIGPEPGLNASRDPAVVSWRRHRGPRMVGPSSGFRLPVISSRQLTPTTHAVELEKPKAFMFRPTQFTFLQLLTEQGMDVRPMSLATSPTRPHLEYAVRLSDSPYKRAFAALQPEDEVLVFGPIGDFVLHEMRPAILIAGGIGVTPLKGMAEYAADRALPIPIRLVYSNPNEDEIIYRDELEALQRRNAHFRVLHTLTRTADRGWQGTAGRIHRKLLQEAARDLKDPIYYVSGTPSMVMGTFWLLRDEGIPEGDIEVEAFRGYR
jgi:ferredoxin-NADP reductase